jgi:hypothetical protein
LRTENRDPHRRRPASWRSAAIAFAGFLALAVFWTWPLSANLSDRIAHDPGDPVLNTWILWWNARALPLTSAWWNAPVFFPLAGGLTLSEHLAGIGAITTPIQLAGGSPILAYNIALLVSYALSAWFAYLLVHRLAGSRFAGVCAGLAFGFAPYRAGQLAHIQVVTSQWIPAMLFALHAYVSNGRRIWLVAFAAAWMTQALSNGYYLLFVPVLVALWIVWFVDWRASPARGFMILLVWIVSSVPLVPVLLKYRQVHDRLGLSRTATEIAGFSATPASFFHAPPLLAFWSSSNVSTQEDFLFPGVTAFTLVAVTILAMVVRRQVRDEVSARSPLIFYAGATLVMSVFALGPGAESDGFLRWLRPYRWLSMLPGYVSLRVPTRFAMLSSLCLAVSAGLVIARILRQHGVRLRASDSAVRQTGSVRERRMTQAVDRGHTPDVGRRDRTAGTLRVAIVGCVIVAGLVVDGLPLAMPLATPPPRVVVPAPADAPVIELPPDDARVNVAAMYRAMFHRRALINGYSGHVPPHYAILSIALRRGDTSPLLHFARGHPLFIIVNDRYDSNGEFRGLVEQLAEVERIDASGAGTLFRLPAQPRQQPVGSGRAWLTRFRELERETLEIDLGENRIVRAIAFALRWHYAEIGERLAIEASEDGQEWRQVWLGWMGEPAVAAAIEDPLLVPIRLPLADIRARFLRIHPAPRWLARDLEVLGP